MRIPTHAARRRTSQSALRNPTFEQLAGAGSLIVWLSTDAGRLISTQLLASGAAARAVAARAKDSTTSIAFQLAWWNRCSGRPMVDNMTSERSVRRLDPRKLERAR